MLISASRLMKKITNAFNGDVYSLDVPMKEALALFEKGKPIPFTEAHSRRKWLFYKTGLIVPANMDEPASKARDVAKINSLAIEASARAEQFLKVDTRGFIIGTGIEITEELLKLLREDVPNIEYKPTEHVLTWEY